MTLLGKHWWKRPIPIEDAFASRFFLSLNIIVSIFFAITFTFPTGYHERLVPFINPENGEKYSLFMILLTKSQGRQKSFQEAPGPGSYKNFRVEILEKCLLVF